MVIALAGVFGARFMFASGPARSDAMEQRFAGPHRWLLAKYYIDELYETVIGRPLDWLSRVVFLRLGDKFLFDGTLHALAGLGRFGGGLFARVQSGRLQRYAWLVMAGIAGALLWSLNHG